MCRKFGLAMAVAVLVSGCTTTRPSTGPQHAPMTEAPASKPRVIVMTDGEIDDHSSMARFFMYASDFEILAIIETNSIFQKVGHSDEDWYEKQLDAYEQIHPKLIMHNPDYPTAEYLRARSFIGDEDFDHLRGLDRWAQVPGREVEYYPHDWPDTPGSDAIVRILLEDNPAPVHIQAWGGGNTASRAFHKLKTHHPADYERAVSKVVMYNIWYQDDAGNYIETHHPLVTMIYNGAFAGTWNYRSQPATREFIAQHVNNGHGPLGALYPQGYISEGDTPAFLYGVANGLRNHEHPSFGGWGGRYRRVDGFDRVWRDADDERPKGHALRRWIDDANHDFQARMDWAVAARFEDANHHPIATLRHNDDLSVRPGEWVTLDASPSTDPDGDAISFRWWQYHEAGTSTGAVILSDDAAPTIRLQVPDGTPGSTIHMIVEVRDNGAPALLSYRRVILTLE